MGKKQQQPHQSCIYMFMTLLQQTLHETSAIPKECHGKIMSVEDWCVYCGKLRNTSVYYVTLICTSQARKRLINFTYVCQQ